MGNTNQMTLQPHELIGIDWDHLTEEEQALRLNQLNISDTALTWFQLTEAQQKKVYNAWRRWIANCE
jgi:hypothetical protein